MKPDSLPRILLSTIVLVTLPLTGYAAWNWSTYVTSGDIFDAEKWNSLVSQISIASTKPDWTAAPGSNAGILNKPTIPAAQVQSDWTASSGTSAILNKPTIPTLINPDWNATSGFGQILNKPTLAANVWTVSGVNIYNANTGNVGIGTATPHSKLHIAGGPLIVNDNAYGVARFFDGGSQAYFTIYTKIPWGGGHAPMLRVRGYGYSTGLDFDTSISWYDYAGTFYNPGGATHFSSAIGSRAPSRVRLGSYNDGGTNMIAIEIANDGQYWTSYSVDVYMHYLPTSTISGWTTAAGAFPGTVANVTNVPQTGHVIQASNGSVNIPGTLTAGNLNQAPVLSTTNRTSGYLASTAGWQYMGTSVTFTVPPGPNRNYRIGARIMGQAPTAGNYLLYSVSSSSTTLAGIPTGLWYPHEYLADTGWHSNFTEGYVTLAPGTYTYYMFVHGGASYTVNYHHDPVYTNIMVWPM